MPDERFFQAVYVLQRLGGPAASEPEDIPSHVAYADETESLLHHPDKILVLRTLADELAKQGLARPRAILFEAYARLGLGQREEAAELLTRYVARTVYQARHYALLCSTLAEINNDTSLLIICLEWQKRDPSCHEARIRYTWATLHNIGRYADAGTYVLEHQSCLGSMAKLYAAKSLLALGKTWDAERLLREALDEVSPISSAQLQRHWEILKGMQRM